MKWQLDLIKDIRTFTDFDDQDGGVPHPFGRNKWDVIENCCPKDWGIGFARKK